MALEELKARTSLSAPSPKGPPGTLVLLVLALLGAAMTRGMLSLQKVPSEFMANEKVLGIQTKLLLSRVQENTVAQTALHLPPRTVLA